MDRGVEELKINSSQSADPQIQTGLEAKFGSDCNISNETSSLQNRRMKLGLSVKTGSAEKAEFMNGE